MVTECFNTCFVLDTDGGRMLVDCGGGSGIVRQLKAADIDIRSIHDIFLTHCHCDHFSGLVWVMRMICTAMKQGNFEGNVTVRCHEELAEQVVPICSFMLGDKLSVYFKDRIKVVTVHDGESCEILSRPFTFFDIQSTKARQFGFKAELSSGVLAFMGDEPVSPSCEKYACGADWLLCEAFCLYDDRERFHPYQKHHSTVRDAALLADRLNVRNLLLWHTEEENLARRKELYTKEARDYCGCTVYVPDDLETVIL